MNNKELLMEVIKIVRSTQNNVNFESKHKKSQLLAAVSQTLTNLATLLQGVANQIEELEKSRHEEMTLKNEAYFFILGNGLLDAFREYTNKNK